MIPSSLLLTLCIVTVHQNPDEPAVLDDEPKLPILFTFGGGAEHRFAGDLDEGGEVRRSRFDALLSARTHLTEEFMLDATVAYSLNRFRFRGDTVLNPTGLAGGPWDDIHRITARGTLTFFRPDYSIFGGPIIDFSRETDARWSDSMTGGGFAGAAFKINERLQLGGGVGIVSRLEDSALIFPIVIIDWDIADNLRLTNRLAAASPGGLELIWTVTDKWELGLGATYEFERFRLDERGPVPEGVGEVTGVPVIARSTHKLTDELNLTLYGGVTMFSRYKLDDRDGRAIARDDLDPTALVGVSFRASF